MTKKRKIFCIIGTRPEAIKMAPVIYALTKEPWAHIRILATAQHRQMLDQVNDFFGIKADIDLNIMRPNQTLASLTSNLLIGVDEVLQKEKPDAVLVQGDTTTVLAATLACFYRGIPVGHVEAGLRTGDILNPFPEEANRVITGKLSRWHFAPTEVAKNNLLREGVAADKVMVTGNTVIDALLYTSASNVDIGVRLNPDVRMVLVTMHRRENFGEPIRRICAALVHLADHNRDVQFLFPVHPNPNVKQVVHEYLSLLPNFFLCEPLDYAPFVAAMKRSYLILTDSGGVQEEAPALGKPVLVLRDETERPEAIAAGVVKLVGSDTERIITGLQELLDNESSYRQMARGVSPYGDGMASQRIVSFLREAMGD